MTGLDLSAVERTLLGWMVDEVAIARDNGVSDDELDPETLLLIATAGEPVWSGLGAIQPLNGFTDQGDPDVVRIVDETAAEYRALLPLRADIPARVGDVLTVGEIHGISSDPRMSGRSFSIVHLGFPSSFAVVRFLYLRPILDPAGAPEAPLDPASPEAVWAGDGELPDQLPPGEAYLDEPTGDVYESE